MSTIGTTTLERTSQPSMADSENEANQRADEEARQRKALEAEIERLKAQLAA